MAATMTLQHRSKVLPFRQPCAGVKRTDRKNRLPELTSAEIDSFFENALLTAEQNKQAA